MSIFGKHLDAIEVAESIIDSKDVLVTSDDIRQWHESDLYEWLDAWGDEWDGTDWKLMDSELV